MSKRSLRMMPALLLLALPLGGCETFGAKVAVVEEIAAVQPQTFTIDGKNQFVAGNYGLAAEAFMRAVERDPADAEAWLGLGASHDQLRRFDLADRDYAQVERLSGKSAALLNNRGYSYIMRGEFAKARAQLNAARALDPENPDIQINLAAAIQGRRP